MKYYITPMLVIVIIANLGCIIMLGHRIEQLLDVNEQQRLMMYKLREEIKSQGEVMDRQTAVIEKQRKAMQ